MVLRQSWWKELGTQISRERTNLRLEAVRNIQEIGATYLAKLHYNIYRSLSVTMIGLVVLFGASYFLGTAVTWFPYFGIAMVMLLLVSIAIQISIQATMKQLTQEIIEGDMEK